MRAFHNDPAIKRKYLRRVRAHRLADDIKHGFYWQGGKGCAVGCTIHGGEHRQYETELGIPQVLARLEDRIFEGTANGFAQLWPERFLRAIPVGADLSNVWPRWAVWMLTDEVHGVLRFAQNEGQREAIQAVADLYALLLAGADVSPECWREGRKAANAANAADAAAAAAYADADADAAAAYAAAADAAATFYEAAAEKLLTLLRTSK